MIKDLTDEQLVKEASGVMESQEQATEILQELISRGLPIPGFRNF